MNIADQLLERGVAEHPAIIDNGRPHTYADLRAAVGTIAAELTALGLPAGARVALVGVNSYFWVAAYLGAIKAGLTVVPYSDKATLDDLRRNNEIADCAAVLIDRRLARRFLLAFDGLPVIDDSVLATAPDAATAADAADAVDVTATSSESTDAATDAVLMFTSGTTSLPKAVRITHANIAANTASIISYLGLAATDRALVILPFYYCFGASLLHTHLRMGATLVLCNTFAYPETAVAAIDEHECTIFAGVPSSFQLLLRATSFAKKPLPSLRIIQQAGGKLPPVQIDELVAAQPQADVVVMYGQTEATARLSYLPSDQIVAKRGSIGKGIPGVHLRVLDEDMAEVAPGEKGEIYATGENISPGYLGAPELSIEKFTPYGLRTGDLAVVDEDGYIFVVDRRDDFIKSWGYRVASQEVEAAALQLPGLVSAGVIGIPDDESGEAVVLFVTRAPAAEIDVDEIAAHCRSVLPKHMVPSHIHFLDALPLNANGKVAKNDLRRLATESAMS